MMRCAAWKLGWLGVGLGLAVATACAGLWCIGLERSVHATQQGNVYAVEVQVKCRLNSGRGHGTQEDNMYAGSLLCRSSGVLGSQTLVPKPWFPNPGS
eukprot:207662-Chlamydomonas_euryale.AAC.3